MTNIAARARVSKAQRRALDWLGARRCWWVADNPEQSDLMSLWEAWPGLVERNALRRAPEEFYCLSDLEKAFLKRYGEDAPTQAY